MSIVKSLLFGSEGSYNILGTEVDFLNTPSSYHPLHDLQSSDTSLLMCGAGIISKLAISCINSRVFCWITLGHIHAFVHEMSHAMANKLLTGQNAKVTCFSQPCSGECSYPFRSRQYIPDWKHTIIRAAGPIGNIAFSICQIFAAIALRHMLPLPITCILGGSAIIWICGELLYACTSALQRDSGDFGSIATQQGNIHLLAASAALISECALGIFAVVRLGM